MLSTESEGSGAWAVVLLSAIALNACSISPYRTSLAHEWIPSPNYNERRPNFVVIHHTSNDNSERALATLRDPIRELSAHYLIDRDGRLYQLVDERARAWHAGTSYWGGNTDINSSSIGIELDNNGEELFAEPQIATLLALLGDLRERYKIPAANFLGHGDVAPRRKVDPGRHFPWERLAAEGFGLWCDPREPFAPSSLDSVSALQAIGYDVANSAAAIAAFRRHYRGEEGSQDAAAGLSEEELGLAQCLVERKRTL